MDFDTKQKLIKRTVQSYIDRYCIWTEADLVNEAWTHTQVIAATKPAHVVKATKDSCVDFLRRWYKGRMSKDRKTLKVKVVPVSVLTADKSRGVSTYKEDIATVLLKEDLYAQMSKEERKIADLRLQGWTYKEIAEEEGKSIGWVCWIHKRMQNRMSKKSNKLLGE